MNVSTLSGTVSPAIYITNSGYNNGTPSQTTYVTPLGITVGLNGNVFVFDRDTANVVRKIDSNGVASKFCGNDTFTSPSFAYGFADGNSNTTLFSNITAIATDKLGNVFVIDNNRLRKIDPNGNCTTITGQVFNNAQGLSVDASGNIFVSDTGNKAVKKVVGNTVTTVASGFVNPKGIFVDVNGNIYVCDTTMIKKVTSAGVVSNYASGFGEASDVCMDVLNNLLVTDTLNNQVKKVDLSGNVTVYAGNGRSKFRDGDVNMTAFGASFYAPTGIDITPNGDILVADTNNQRFRKITL